MVTVDLADNFGAWNEEFLDGSGSVVLDNDKIKLAPSGTLVVNLPLYPHSTNRDLRFLLPKLQSEAEVKIQVFYHGGSLDILLIAKLAYDSEPVLKRGTTYEEMRPPFPSIVIYKR